MISKKYILILIPIVGLIFAVPFLINNSQDEAQSTRELFPGRPDADPVEIASRVYSVLDGMTWLEIDRIIYSSEFGICVISLLSEDFTQLNLNEDSYYRDCCFIARELYHIEEIDAVIVTFISLTEDEEVNIEASYGIERGSPIKHYWDEIFSIEEYKETVEFFFSDMRAFVMENYDIGRRDF